MILTPNTIRWWQTINLNIGVFSVGCCIGIFGTVLLDLADIYGSHVDQVVYIISTRSAGSIAACLVGGVTFRHCNVQQVVILNSLLGGLCLVLVPVCPSLLTCHIACFLLGLSIGFIEIGANVWIITIWKSRSAAVLQFYHFMFGVGAMLAPFGTEPFLSKKHHFSILSTNVTTDSNSTDLFLNHTAFERVVPVHDVPPLERSGDHLLADVASLDSRIYIPFAVFGSIYMSSAVFMFASYLADSRDIRNDDDGQASTTTTTTSHTPKVSARLELIIVVGSCLYVLLGVASEQNYASMIAVYVIQSLDFSKSSGAFVVSVFWAAFTLSRVAATVMSMRVNPMTMLCASHVLLMLAAVTLMALPRVEWVVWSMTALYAFGVSPFFGNVCSWALQYTFLGHGRMSAIMICVCLGAMMPPIIIGPFIERHPIALIYSAFAIAAIMTATALGLALVGRHIGRSSRRKAPTAVEHIRNEYALVGDLSPATL